MRQNQKSKPRIALYKLVWCKIRYWQNLFDMSDIELAELLEISERTLRDYDKNARTIMLEKVDRFLYINHMELGDLMEM